MPKRGMPATPAQRSALIRGQKKRAALLADSPTGVGSQAHRWSCLLDGTLKVEDLSDQEIRRNRVAADNGVFSGSAPRLPSHLVAKFQNEALKRAQSRFLTAAPEAVQALINMGTDPDVSEAVRVRALQLVLERALGKTPDTVHVTTHDKWGALLGDGLLDDRALADLAGDGSAEDSGA